MAPFIPKYDELLVECLRSVFARLSSAPSLLFRLRFPPSTDASNPTAFLSSRSPKFVLSPLLLLPPHRRRVSAASLRFSQCVLYNETSSHDWISLQRSVSAIDSASYSTIYPALRETIIAARTPSLDDFKTGFTFASSQPLMFREIFEHEITVPVGVWPGLSEFHPFPFLSFFHDRGLRCVRS